MTHAVGFLLFAAVSLLAVFWLRDRKRIAEQLRNVCGRQQELDTALSSFVEESEKITRELSRLISAACPTKRSSTPAEAALRDRPEAELQKPRSSGVEKRHLVLSLAQKGNSVAEVAERLMVPTGEVGLILNLDQGKRSPVRATA